MFILFTERNAEHERRPKGVESRSYLLLQSTKTKFTTYIFFYLLDDANCKVNLYFGSNKRISKMLVQIIAHGL